MPIVPWLCALGDAPAHTLTVAATVAIAPPDNSIDTNKIVITGTGTISSFGTTAPLVTKDITFAPSGGPITLINSAQLALLGNADRTIAARCFGRFTSDGAGHWQEIGFFAAASTPATTAVAFNLYTASATITIPPGCSSAQVRLVGPGGNRFHCGTTTNPGGCGGYAEKWLGGLLAGNTLALTIGMTYADTSILASGTQTIGTITCGAGESGGLSLDGAASGGDFNIGGTLGYISLLSPYGLGGSIRPNNNVTGTQGACAINWFS